MGCVVSRIDKEGRVQVCKERKKLMKQLVGYRGEFADAQLAYLKALKNTGVTLRQFTDSDSLELETTSYAALTLPPSPPFRLLLSPPPPPSFNHGSRQAGDVAHEEERMDCSTPPPPTASSSSDYWGIFESTSPLHHPKQSEDEDQGINNAPEETRSGEIVDGNSSTTSMHDKDSKDVAMVVWNKTKTLEGITKELDDYFLEASSGGKAIAVFTDKNIGDNSLPWKLNENKKNRSNSAKVVSALSWSWSSKSLSFARDYVQFGSNEPCKPGAHCLTLDKLYVAEQKLYKEVKEEESAKLELERKLVLLQKQDENQDWTKTEKIQSRVENLENVIRRLQHSISTSSSSILDLIDEELYPQLDTLTSGMMEMWKMMYKCHQVQNLISQQLNHVTDISIDLTTESHRQATSQLETEVSFWYYSFCKLMKYQQDYVRTLCRWIHLIDCLVDDKRQCRSLSAVRKLCDEWQRAFETLPDKVALEAIRSFLLAIQAIIRHQAEERNQRKKSDKLEERLQRELISVSELEKKVEGTAAVLEGGVEKKVAKIEGLKKRVDMEKGKYLNLVEENKTMTINNLKTSLPNVFEAMKGFSKASVQMFEAIHGHTRPEIPCDDASKNSAD